METKLFVVGTPIGNMDDITLRALQTLKSVDIIACEDTRTTLKLLKHFNIENKKLISYHNFNEKQSAKGIIELIKKGNKVALVSDAGMPVISDPGFSLIEQAKEKEIKFEIIPGVSAITTSIVASSLGPDFTFLGFGKNKKEKLNKQIENLLPGTYIIFCAPHKLVFLVETLKKWHANANICIANELTKKFEKFYFGNPDEILNQIEGKIKGEYTIVFKIDKIKKEKVNKYKKE